jgi:arylsulfatase A-like enzyme
MLPTPRPRRLRLGVALAALVAVSAVSGCGEEELRPDLLLLSAASLRADRLACYGGPPELGAAICSLGGAAPATRYTWAFSTAPSGPPAAASLLTSLHPSRHGVGDSAASFLPSRVRSLAEELASAGYATAAFVSEAELNRSRNLDQGFDVYDDRLVHRPGLPPSRSAARTAAAAIAWLERAPAPRFLWVHFGDLHAPLAPPAISSYEAYEARYRATVGEIDAQVANLLRAAGARSGAGGLGVLFTATHGEAIGEGGRWFTHGVSLGLEQIRIPLLWRPPPGAAAEPPPAVLDTPVSIVDAAPTLLAAAGRPAPADFEGEPLPRSSALAAGARPVFAESPDAVAVVSGGRYYVRPRRPGGPARVALLGDAEDGAPLPAPVPVLSTNRARLGADQLEELVTEFLISARAPEPALPGATPSTSEIEGGKAPEAHAPETVDTD